MTKQLHVDTTYTMENLEELQRVVGENFVRRRALIQRGGMLALGIAGVVVGLVVAVKGKPIRALICVGAGVICLLWCALFYTIQAWTAWRALGKQTLVSHFALERKYVMVYLKNQSTRHDYENCSQLLEAERCIYVMMKDGQGLMLDKEQVKGGTVEELRRFLEEQTGKTITWVGKKRKNA